MAIQFLNTTEAHCFVSGGNEADADDEGENDAVEDDSSKDEKKMKYF